MADEESKLISIDDFQDSESYSEVHEKDLKILSSKIISKVFDQFYCENFLD